MIIIKDKRLDDFDFNLNSDLDLNQGQHQNHKKNKGNTRISLNQFMSIVTSECSVKKLEGCIIECACDIICKLLDCYSSALANKIPKNYRKNKIMNFDIIDYLKLNIINTSFLLETDYSGTPYGQLYVYLDDFNKLYTNPSVQEFINLFASYRSKIFNECKYLYQRINNKLIADYFGKSKVTYDLEYIDDKIGDTAQLSSESIVDVGNREQLFVFINNEWLIENDDVACHSDIIAHYLNSAINNNYIYSDLAGKKIYTVDEVANSIDKINELHGVPNNTVKIVKEIESKPLFFGSIQGNIGYLASAKNINKKAAAEMIKQKFNVKKVYFQQQQLYKYTRLAQLYTNV